MGDSFFSSKLIRAFLGISRFEKLGCALRDRFIPEAELSFSKPFIALFLGLTPLLVFLTSRSNNLASVMIGVGALLSFLQMTREKTPKRPSIKQQFSLTHTSFAIGCIPAVIIILLFPQGLYAITQKGSTIAPNPALIVLILYLLAVWSGTTEELLYRGLVLKNLRRWSFIKNGFFRDCLAVILSAIIFGACHVPLWGLPLSIATTGIGVGFGIAFLAINESVWTLAVYHSSFNFLSLLIAWLSYRA